MTNFMQTEWGLVRNCFVSSPPEKQWLSRVFTGRSDELSRAIRVVVDAPRRLLINGLFGIGKTITIQEMSRQLEENYNEVLVVNEWLYSQDINIGAVILRGLSSALKEEDSYARDIHDLYLGQEVFRKQNQKTSDEIAGGYPKFLSTELPESTSIEKQISLKDIIDPVPAVRKLLNDAIKRYPNRRIVITVDDLDKRDPDTVRNMLTSSRDLLHDPRCSFVLTGHPLGIMRDAYSSAGGIIDHEIELKVMDHISLRLMIAKYLAAGRRRTLRIWKKTKLEVDEIPDEALLPFDNQCVNEMIKRSYGIPRVLNIICFNILEVAASKEFSQIGYHELTTCWDACANQLRHGIRPDLRNLLETMMNQRSHINVNDIPDDLYSSLKTDTHEDLLSRLDFALQYDLLVTNNGRDLVLNSLVEPFERGAQISILDFKKKD